MTLLTQLYSLETSRKCQGHFMMEESAQLHKSKHMPICNALKITELHSQI